MKAIVKIAPNITLEIEERDEMETLHRAIVLAHPPRRCNVCGNTQGIYLTSNKDKEGNVYVNAKCPKCGAKAKLGQYKAGGFFWHRFEQYKPLQNQAGPGTASSPGNPAETGLKTSPDGLTKGGGR